MRPALLQIPDIFTAANLAQRQVRQEEVSWSVEEFAGELVELRAVGPSALLTLAAALLLDAQRRNEPAVWLTSRDDLFYPPDFEACGICLEALAVVVMPDPQHVAVAADKLARSGAFGLLLLDLGVAPTLPDGVLHRLLQQASRHRSAIVCLTEADVGAPSLGSIVSARIEVSRSRVATRFQCVARAVRDRRRQPGWQFVEERDGTLGLR